MVSIVRNFSIDYRNQKCKVLFIKESDVHLYYFFIQDHDGHLKSVKFDEVSRVYPED